MDSVPQIFIDTSSGRFLDQSVARTPAAPVELRGGPVNAETSPYKTPMKQDFGRNPRENERKKKLHFN
jgi:hypothetical protein